ncbi:Ig-like domain-containing protein [Streptomyces sp. NPDC048279]|uniref:Ig-like domain-containing protein n=1 Tax=Streptomyces sp. NPDC048279 TaxID=3154714 RepID=UPI0034269E2F
MSYDLGAPVPLTMTVKDASGAPADSGNMRLTITLPDDSTAIVDPVAPSSTGSYAYSYPTTQVGRHAVRWLGTGANPAACTDVFDVRPASSLMLFSLADGKAQLDIPASSTGDDDELRQFIEATTAAVEFFVGPVVPRTVEQVVCGDRAAWVLHTMPVMAVTAITPIQTWQQAIDPADLDVDTETGILRRTDGLIFYSGDYRVTYKAGRTVTSPNITLAGKLILQHLWRTQYGSARGPSVADDYQVTEPIPGFGYAIPNRALQLLQNDRQMGGFA